jgi:hypothetical protein
MRIQQKNNKLVRKTILSMFSGSLAATITAAIALMADTIIAGIVFGVMILLDPFRLTNMIVRLVGIALIYQGAVNMSIAGRMR